MPIAIFDNFIEKQSVRVNPCIESSDYVSPQWGPKPSKRILDNAGKSKIMIGKGTAKIIFDGEHPLSFRYDYLKPIDIEGVPSLIISGDLTDSIDITLTIHDAQTSQSFPGTFENDCINWSLRDFSMVDVTNVV